MKVVVRYGQSIWDIALQEYGSVEGVVQLMKDNPTIVTSMDTELVAGTILKVVSEAINTKILKYFTDNYLKPVSGMIEAIGGGDYSDDFNEDFTI